MSTSNDSKPARPTRRNLNLASPPDSALDRIAVLYGDQDLNINVASILERYLVMLHRATPKFSDLEICVVIDALGDNWEPTPTNVSQIPREVLTAIITDRLDAKWGIDTDKFSARLDRTSFYERTTLAEITAAYWRMATTDSRPQDIINQIKRLIRPASSRITPTARPRRISAHLFHQDPPAGSLPPSSGDHEDEAEGTDPEIAGTEDTGTRERRHRGHRPRGHRPLHLRRRRRGRHRPRRHGHHQHRTPKTPAKRTTPTATAPTRPKPANPRPPAHPRTPCYDGAPSPHPRHPALTRRATRPRSHAARLSGHTIPPPEPSPGQVHHPTRSHHAGHRFATGPRHHHHLGHPDPITTEDVSPAIPR